MKQMYRAANKEREITLAYSQTVYLILPPFGYKCFMLQLTNKQFCRYQIYPETNEKKSSLYQCINLQVKQGCKRL